MAGTGDAGAKKHGQGKPSKVESGQVMAAKVKRDYQANITQANFIMMNIQSNHQWAQFGGVGQDNLKNAMGATTKELDALDFHRQYMIDQKGGLKKRMEAAVYEKSCHKFALALQGPVSNLGKECRKIMMQYEAGLAAERE